MKKNNGNGTSSFGTRNFPKKKSPNQIGRDEMAQPDFFTRRHFSEMGQRKLYTTEN